MPARSYVPMDDQGNRKRDMLCFAFAWLTLTTSALAIQDVRALACSKNNSMAKWSIKEIIDAAVVTIRIQSSPTEYMCLDCGGAPSQGGAGNCTHGAPLVATPCAQEPTPSQTWYLGSSRADPGVMLLESAIVKGSCLVVTGSDYTLGPFIAMADCARDPTPGIRDPHYEGRVGWKKVAAEEYKGYAAETQVRISGLMFRAPSNLC